ncbi:MAG: omp-alpha 1 [Pelosinus sp.]|nr:omp-alpha 1 [Pelosinus sp.]
MKRQLVLALGISLMFGGTSLAAVVNPFDDVPANHWAYDSISKLAQAGIVDGYSDGKFKGGNVLTRYEMAAVVGKAMSNEAKQSNQLKAENKVELEKLEAEFSTELNNMGVRVAKLEENASSIKFGGGVRLRYQVNPSLKAKNTGISDQSRIQERLNIDMSAKVIDKVNFYGDISNEWTSNGRAQDASLHTTTTDSSFHIDRAELAWKNSDYSVSAGRFWTRLGQGITWNSGVGNYLDGFYGTYKFDKVSVSAGYADFSSCYNVFGNNTTGYTGNSLNAFLGNVKFDLAKNASITIANFKVLNPENAKASTITSTTSPTGRYGYAFDQWAVGGNIKSGNFGFNAEVVENKSKDVPSDAQTKGYVTKLNWGVKGIPYSIGVEYFKLGNWATDSTYWKTAMWMPGGNGTGNDGAKGFGLVTQYNFASKANVQFRYYKLKPYDEKKSGFSSYRPAYALAVNFGF